MNIEIHKKEQMWQRMGRKLFVSSQGFSFLPLFNQIQAQILTIASFRFFRIIFLRYTGTAEEVVRSVRRSCQWCVLLCLCLCSAFSLFPILLPLPFCSPPLFNCVIQLISWSILKLKGPKGMGLSPTTLKLKRKRL